MTTRDEVAAALVARTPGTEAGKRVLPWHAASHFNRGGLLPAEAHERAVADIVAVEREAADPLWRVAEAARAFVVAADAEGESEHLMALAELAAENILRAARADLDAKLEETT